MINTVSALRGQKVTHMTSKSRTTIRKASGLQKRASTKRPTARKYATKKSTGGGTVERGKPAGSNLALVLGSPVPKKLSPIIPGEILKFEFMEPAALSANKLAKELNVPTNRITEVINATRRITPETAILLAKYFQTTAQFWLNLQNHYDLRMQEYKMASRGW
jgi:antitoxin HigA-1